MKFDYAYLENKKSELSVFQIALIYRNIPLFRAEYEPYMVCPICKEAKLTYVNDQPAYLRTAQKQSHAEDCPLAQLYLSTNRAKTIMNSFNSEMYHVSYTAFLREFLMSNHKKLLYVKQILTTLLIFILKKLHLKLHKKENTYSPRIF